MDNKLTLRTVEKTDLKQIWELCLDVFPEVEGATFEEFTDLWEYRWGSPFRTERDILGWVLADSTNNILGFISYIPLMLRFQDSLFAANSVSTWVVRPEASAQSLDLFRAFGKRDKTVCLLDTTANKIASLMCKRLRMEPIRVKNYQRKLLWIIDPLVFLKTKGYFCSNNRLVDAFLVPIRYMLSVWLKIYLFLKGHKIKKQKQPFKFLPIDEFSDEFERFWEKIKRSLGLVHERTCQFMNWRHFSVPDLKGQVFSFICRDKEDNVLGYLMMKSCGPGEGGKDRLVITDFLIAEGRNDVFLFMMGQAYIFAVQCSAAILEFFGFNEQFLDDLLQFKPIVRVIDHPTYWLKPIEGMLEIDNIWVSGIDGDMNL